MSNEAKLRDYLKRTTSDLRAARRRLDEVEARRKEPIAIVGMSCRYPGGAGSPEQLWELLAAGGDGVSEFPPGRGWEIERVYHPDPENPGTAYTREGGFLDDAAEFDAEFFGIAPREAVAMDPQQRLLLEACWEALEDAGIRPSSLSGTPTGVFTGIGSQDYHMLQPTDRLEGYGITGSSSSVASGRIAYSLGLEGPAITVDTACSTSLVALHLASQALRGGECEMALAGGVTVFATPGVFVEFSRQRVLSPDGRCKSFAEAADGAGFSEGVGVVALERLSDAQRQGHPILAVVRGSAVNQDGASNGLAAPNGPSQQRVIRQALANAGLEPKDVDAVEAHGTGTTLGDPIEAQALLATYGQERENGALRLGSIKSNIGHTAAAAGVAGVIKMTMALREGLLPRTLHVDAPSSHVDWTAGQVELLTEQEPWQPNGRPRRAGVSSFGISGTNAHVILEEAPAPVEAEDREEAEPLLKGPVPLPLSAKSKPALQDAAARLASHLREHPELDPTDIAHSLAKTRSAFPHRAVLLATEPEELLGELDALAAGRGQSTRQSAEPRPVFLFAGQGAQHPRMAYELHRSLPAFAQRIEECEQALEPFVDWSLSEVLADPEGAWMQRLDIVQPALFAVMVSLARLWQSCGVRPALLAGHSQGEIAAAHISGALSLDDAARVIARRGQAMAKIAGKGAMASLSLAPEALTERLGPYGQSLSLAAINGPASVVVSGEPEAIEQLLAQCEAEGLRAQRIAVDYAAHSHQIEALKDELLEAFAPIEPGEAEIALRSTVSGEQVEGKELGPTYWYRNLRQSVLLEPVLTTMLNEGRRGFIEISPHPVLAFGATECADALGITDAQILSTLRREEGGPERFARSLAEAHAAGVELDWDALFRGRSPKRVPLPTYPFQRQRYWLEGGLGSSDPAAIGQAPADHPLLGSTVELAGEGGEGLLLTGRLSLKTHPWLAEHEVAGNVLLPGAAFAELALSAGERAGAERLAELTLAAPLIVPAQGAVQIQLSVSEPSEEGAREISIHSRPEADPEGEPQPWTLHATGTLTEDSAEPPAPLAQWPPQGAQQIELAGFYEGLADLGLAYGPAFQGLGAAYRKDNEIYAEVSLAPRQREEAASFAIHPALLDAALHAGAMLLGSAQDRSLRLPFAWSGVSIAAQGASELRVRLSEAGEGAIALELYDQAGIAVATVESLLTRPLSRDQLTQQRAQTPYEIRWSEVELKAQDREDEPLLWRPQPKQGLPAAAEEIAREALERLQGFLADADNEGRRLAIATAGAIATTEEESPELSLAPVWGLVRSAQAEHPGRFVLIDTDASEASGEALARAAAQSTEPQLALREGRALAPRLAPAQDDADSLLPPPGPYRLESSGTGSLDGLSLVSNPRATEPLGPTEVRIQMRAAGLNFREVMVALGFAVPGEAMLGGEGAGVLCEVGAEVEDLAPGERVMGMIPDSFGPLTIADRSAIVAIPAGLSHEQAAAIPVVYTTAYYGLFDLADLKRGERVLIHAGAGGVGMAAIQLAKRAGAEVFATASPAKWEALRELGLPAENIASSRDLSFKDAFLEATGGEGVDVVLNSLAKDHVDASLELLPRGGRFLEMGKTDIRDPEEVEAAHPNVTYRAFSTFEAGPERTTEMLSEVVSRFEAGELDHSPLAAWDLRRAPQAFRHLREGRNTGKVVLTIPRPLDPDKTILISGGTGILAARISRHLISEHGARHLLLASRSGARAEGAEELKQELTELGAEVRIEACDVSERTALEGLLDSIPSEHPLGAVIHAAGALDDRTLESLDPESLATVFAPKANAAQHLHELTRDTELDAFVLFSSAAGALGSPGQANYAAANVFLDALAARRRAEGLPATSIAWGLWATATGLTSGLGEAGVARMRRVGIEPLTDAQGLELFDACLASDRPLAVGIGLNRRGLQTMASAGALPRILSELAPKESKRRTAVSGALAAKLATLPQEQRLDHVQELILEEIAAVLGHGSPAAIDPAKAFKDMGFDSLAAVELKNRLSATSGLRLAPTVVFDYPTPAKLAAHLLDEATASGAATQAIVRSQVADEPIAIVGVGCRYPGGVRSAVGLWELVASGSDGIGPFPADRGWDLERLYDPDPDSAGTSYARDGGFLDGAAEFDAEFFGIAPREALAMDPQQRLLLETCWEALEDAGIDPASLAGTSTGVFAGISSQDYQLLNPTHQAFVGYGSTGNLLSIASGRVAYSLGLEGPAMTVDTACSSSLVALHLAAQALRQGECSLALAGGVTVLSTPAAFMEFSRQRGLAPDGRCKSFAEGADGTSLSDGVGVVALARLSDAEREGHPVLAVVKGSAVNQDGASNGLTAPNGPSQQRVIRQALANAGLEPKDVDAVEAHGTGTVLGDPIEAQAVLATYGKEREQPLRLGSLKSNIGHTQAAAGVAGVIKMTMAMREGALPKTLHVDSPSTKVDWEAGQVELLTEQEPWQPNGRPRRAGISSFGISGTNAHVILEEAPAPVEAKEEAKAEPLFEGPLPLALSAKSKPALADAAARLASHLREHPELDPTDLAYSLATTRSAFSHRAVLLATDSKELQAELDALAEGKGQSTQQSAEPRPVFLFAGQGAQHPRMAYELHRSLPAFAQRIEECEQALEPFVDWSLSEVLADPEGAWMQRLDIVQPALFAVMVSLARLWGDFGVRPALVAGHSQGEIAAAHISGALSLDDAARVIARRGSAMAKIAGKGAMASVSLAPEALTERLAPYGQSLSLAAINGPASVVVSGEPEAIEQLLAQCEAEQLRAQRIAVDYAAHSHQIEALRDELLEAFAPIEPRDAEIALRSTVSGEQVEGKELGPEYWYRNLRQSVLLEPVLTTMLNEGRRGFIEISPHPVLAFGATECADALGITDAHILATLRREEGGPERFARSLAEAHAAGIELDWDALFRGRSPKRVPLPTYPFQGQRYWIDAASGAASDPAAIGQGATEHPLLASKVTVAGGQGCIFTGRISPGAQPWLADHAVFGTALFPGTGFVELALAAGREAECEQLHELALEAPLVLDGPGAVQIQVSVGELDEHGRRPVAIYSRPEPDAGASADEGEWTRHASGSLAPVGEAPERLETWPPQGSTEIEVGDFYERLAEHGLEYGPAFQGLEAAWQLDGEVFAEVSLAEQESDEATLFGIHPALFDAAIHSGVALAAAGGAIPSAGEGDDGPSAMWLPFSWQGVQLVVNRSPGAALAHLLRRQQLRDRGIRRRRGAGGPRGVARLATDRAEPTTERQPSPLWARVGRRRAAGHGGVRASPRRPRGHHPTGARGRAPRRPPCLRGVVWGAAPPTRSSSRSRRPGWRARTWPRRRAR